MDCLFCNIVQGKLNTEILHEDEHTLAFADIHPQAPTHLLIIPKKHLSTLNDLQDEDTLIAGQLIQTARKLAKSYGLADDGYRILMNCNEQGGQSVYHIHMHLLGGRPMKWPPG